MGDATAEAIAHLRRFARAMRPELPAVDVALAEVRRLFDDTGEPYLIVGGVAVVHHGYARTTEDIDVLHDEAAALRLDALLSSHGFERLSTHRLRHGATGVRVDLLVGGAPLPRANHGNYPRPADLAPSAEDAHVVGIEGLVELKLLAGRHRDHADVVELVKRLSDARYDALEASTKPALRAELADLRRDALDELQHERDV